MIFNVFFSILYLEFCWEVTNFLVVKYVGWEVEMGGGGEAIENDKCLNSKEFLGLTRKYFQIENIR